MLRGLPIVVLLLVLSASAGAQVSQSFADGVADRTTWEDWLGDSAGEFHAGAAFWSAHGGGSQAVGCRGGGPPRSDQWIAGCEEAQQRIVRFELRKKVDAGYRRGWDSVADKSATDQPPPANTVLSPVLPRRHAPIIAVPRASPF